MQAHNVVKPAKSDRGKFLYTPDEEKEIARRVARGESQSAVGDSLNVHRNTISNICARHPEVFDEEKVKQQKDAS